MTLLGRLGALRELKLDQLGAAVDTYSKILKLEPEHRETIAALERILTNAEHEHRRRAPAGADLQDPRRLDAPHRRLRGGGAPRADPEQKIALYRQIADGYEVGLDDPGRAYEALGRALGRGSAERRGADGRRTARPRARQAGRSGRPLWAARDRRLRSGAKERALSQDRAPLRGRPRRRSPGGRRLRRGAGSVAARSRGGQRARAALSARRRLPEPGAAAAAQGGDRRRAGGEEGALLPGGAALRRGPRGSRELGEGVPARALRRRRRRRRRSISWSGSTSASGAGTISRTSTPRRRSWRRRRPTRSRCCSCSARSTTASSAIRSARSRPTARSSISIPRTTTPRRRSIASTSSSNAGTTCSPFSSGRPRWRLRPRRWSRLRFRIGELWREHLKDLARAVEAYRQVLTMDPGHEPTVRALEALMAGGEAESAVLAAQVLEPIYESAGEWDRVIAVYEVMQAQAEDAAAPGGAARPDGGDRGAASVAPERRIRHLRARAARRSDQPGRAVSARSPGGRDRPLGQARQPVRRRSWRRSTIRAGRSISCCASAASTKRRPTSRRRRSPPTARRSRSRGRTSRRSSRSIVSTGGRSSGRSWRRSCAARSASPPMTISGSRSPSAWRRSTSWR